MDTLPGTIQNAPSTSHWLARKSAFELSLYPRDDSLDHWKRPLQMHPAPTLAWVPPTYIPAKATAAVRLKMPRNSRGRVKFVPRPPRPAVWIHETDVRDPEHRQKNICDERREPPP